MPSVLSGTSAPATSVVTTAETLAANIPVSPVAEPGGSPQTVVIRGVIIFTTGASTTGVQVKLRVGQNNTTTAQVGDTEQEQVAASTSNETISFEFIDAAGQANMTASGYSLTVTSSH
jgi:hypothetical protein